MPITCTGPRYRSVIVSHLHRVPAARCVNVPCADVLCADVLRAVLQRPTSAPHSLAQLRQVAPRQSAEREATGHEHVGRSTHDSAQALSAQGHVGHGEVLAQQPLRLELVSDTRAPTRAANMHWICVDYVV